MPIKDKQKRREAYMRYIEKPGVRDKRNAACAAWALENSQRRSQSCKARRRSKRAMCLVSAARIRANKKGIPFALTEIDVMRLQKTIDEGRCELSGASFTLDGPRSATSPSLDRITPSLGYVPGNVRVVCHCLNAAMGDWGVDSTFAVMRAFVAAYMTGQQVLSAAA